MMQLSFLEDTTNLMSEVRQLKKTQDNVRKGLFRRQQEMKKEMDDLRKELAFIKSHIFEETDFLFDKSNLFSSR